MQLYQKKGPFSKNSSFRAPARLNQYVHVGIQVPYGIPISPLTSDIVPFTYRAVKGADGKYTYTYGYPHVYDISKSLITKETEPVVRIETGSGSSSNLFINRPGILEFDGEVGTTVTVTFLKDMPPETIVDLVYKTE